MTTIRTHKQRDFVVLHKQALEDIRLSWGARGLFAYLLSKPDDWVVNVAYLVTQSEKNGKWTIQNYLKELEDSGYLIRRRQQNELGLFIGWESHLFETTADRETWEQDNGFPPPSNPNRQRKNPSSVKPTSPTTQKPVVGEVGPIINNDSLLINEKIGSSSPLPPSNPFSPDDDENMEKLNKPETELGTKQKTGQPEVLDEPFEPDILESIPTNLNAQICPRMEEPENTPPLVQNIPESHKPSPAIFPQKKNKRRDTACATAVVQGVQLATSNGIIQVNVRGVRQQIDFIADGPWGSVERLEKFDSFMRVHFWEKKKGAFALEEDLASYVGTVISSYIHIKGKYLVDPDWKAFIRAEESGTLMQYIAEGLIKIEWAFAKAKQSQSQEDAWLNEMQTTDWHKFVSNHTGDAAAMEFARKMFARFG